MPCFIWVRDLGHFVCYYQKINNMNSNINSKMNSNMNSNMNSDTNFFFFFCENMYG